MSQEIVKFCLEKGLLLDKEVLNLLSETTDAESAKLIINEIKRQTQQTIITRSLFEQNKQKVSEVFFNLPEKNQKNLKKLKIKLGLSIEITKQEFSKENIADDSPKILNENINNLDIERDLDNLPIKILNENFDNSNINGKMDGSNLKVCSEHSEQLLNNSPIKILSEQFLPNKKLEVKDFVCYFRNRFEEIRMILQEHKNLDNLVSINKISTGRNISLIGIVSDKRVTKNKNILFEIEDLTGKIRVLINKDKKELYEKAEDISLDSVVGFKGSGNSEILFVNDIIFPDSVLAERKKSPADEYALFIGDLHYGSKRFLKDGFLRFIDYLSGKVPNTPEVEKIKYLFMVGDIVTGVGNYPNQEKDLEIKDIEEQFSKLAELLGKIRKDIKIIISPGNHDGVRLMEPQPVIDEKFAWSLHNLSNVVLTGNPATINIGAEKNFSGFNVLTYHGFSFPYYANNVSRLMAKKSMNFPDEIMKYLLKQRHLAPAHTSAQYFPLEKDALLINDVPDIFVAAHTHKSAISYYNNILVISVSSWEGFTPYQEKFGNTPDYCKVPMFNLRTRTVKILDFE